MGVTPFPPYDIRLLPSKIGNGMDEGKTERTGNSAWHSMVGNITGTDTYFRRPEVAAATHWGIGGSLDGTLDGKIYQWVEIGSNFIPWASGPWREPGYGDGQKYVDTWEVYGINALEESIEFSGLVDTPMSVLQWRMGIWLTAAIIHASGKTFGDFPTANKYDKSIWVNMHHREFCQPSYKDCPFPRIYNYTQEYQQGILYTLQHYEGKTNVPDSMQIGSLNIPLPLYQKDSKPTPLPRKPLYVSFDKARTATVYKGATFRQYGGSGSLIYSVAQEEKDVTFIGYYQGEKVRGSDKWYVVDSKLHERVHESGIKQWKD